MPAIDRRELLDALTWLDGYYKSAEGLGRPEGLSRGGKPDFEAIAAWGLDVFLGSRLAGLDVDTSRRNVMHLIEQTMEWKSKHRTVGETPFTQFSSPVPVDRSELLIALLRLDVFYRSWSGLQRPDGLSKNGRPDFEAVAAWIFDVYLNSRLANRSPEDAWDDVVAAIMKEEEWRRRSASRVPVDASTLHGKHLVGYQGWFYTPNDGASNGWGHWFRGPATAENANFDLWPDTREFFDSELEPTEMTYGNGQRARLFSSYNPRVVQRHFDWLADNQIDGVSIGRFLAGTSDPSTRQRLDRVLTNVRAAAEGSGRVFFVWYDVSDNPPNSLVANLKIDWRHIVDGNVTSSPSYLWHAGKPFVGIWGAGAGGRAGSPLEWIEMIGFVRDNPDPRYRATLLISGIRNWRDDPTWAPIFERADVVAPWAVTAFTDHAGADAYSKNVLEPDLASTRARRQGYLPIVFPGFSWHNLQGARSMLNEIPRRGGRFYWRQVYNAINAGADALFTAMYDELDEGTAIMKAAATQADVPAQGTFLSLDADRELLPSDWYLRLAGAATKALRREIALSAEIPIEP